jgi:beta-N-acetylhexosaminidase
LREINTQGNLTFETIRKATTLINPPLAELDTSIPRIDEQIVILTDMRVFQQCSLCPQQNSIELNALEQTVVRLYGPLADGKILPRNLVSYPFQELQNMLDVGTGQLQIENDLRQAEWVIFCMIDKDPAYPGSQAFQNFIGDRPDIIQGKKLILFAFNAPYYLDATDISKLTAYYGLYNRTPQAIEVAARLLFQEILPEGNLPISVLEVGYNLAQITFPRADQEIGLFLDIPDENPEGETPEPEVTPTQIPLRVGDMVPVRTGVIIDHNGHIVPDGTIVTFILTVGTDTGFIQQVEAPTTAGIARSMLRITNSGTVEIKARSESALNSQVLQFIIPAENPLPSETPTAVPSSTMTASPTPTLIPSPTVTVTPEPIVIPPVKTNFVDWLGSLAVTALVALTGFRFASRKGQIRWGIRSSFLAMIGGIIAYSYLALELPGSIEMIERYGFWGITLLALAGAFMGGGIALVWQRLTLLSNRRQV